MKGEMKGSGTFIEIALEIVRMGIKHLNLQCPSIGSLPGSLLQKNSEDGIVDVAGTRMCLRHRFFSNLK